MRSLSAAALAKIAETHGSEPISIIEIDWETGVPTSYADKTLSDQIPGKILELGGLDSLLDVTRSNTTQELNMTLDDSDGTIKSFIDTRDIHQIDVRVYQWFEGLALSDKFLVFAGKLNSPIRWSEGTRSLSFGVLSQIEDKEFGFSPEEGQIPGLPAELVGKTWPSVFGTVLDVPAVQIGQPVTGSTLCGVGLLAGKQGHLDAPIGAASCAQGRSFNMAQVQQNFLLAGAEAWRIADPDRSASMKDQAAQMRIQISNMISARNNEIACALANRQTTLDNAEDQGEGCNPLRVLGGEDFPQGTSIKLDVAGISLTGIMTDQNFDIHTREHAETEAASEEAIERLTIGACGSEDFEQRVQYYNFEMDTPAGVLRRHGYIICTLPSASRPTENQVLKHKYADAGSRVTVTEGENIAYVASITPGTVLDVKARKTFEGSTRLVSVPQEYYTVSVVDYGTVSATVIRMARTLSSRSEEKWADDLFVTFKSTIGPNTVTELKYIIDNYTDLTYDSTSFDAVETFVDILPSHFARLDRENTIDLIKKIAFQARCAIWVSNGVFFIKYLPAEPTSDKTITASDIELSSVEMTTTGTEDIVTKMNITYKISYAEDPKNIILRNNVSRYGVREEDFDFFIYSNADIVYHAASFWMIRLSNMWKRLSFRGYLNLLELETFDTVTLDSPNYVADAAVKGVVNVANYNSGNNTIDFEIEVPVKMGYMVEHPFYWPKDSVLTYPSAFDTEPGGGGLGSLAVGTLPGTVLSGTPFDGIGPQTVLIGGSNAVFGETSDLGTARPGDSTFTAGEVVVDSTYVDLDTTPVPVLDLTIQYVDKGEEMQTVLNPHPFIVDIRTTKVYDSEQAGGRSGVLADFVDGIDEFGRLVLKTDAEWTDGSIQGVFDFKYDTEGEQYGAGTAFLEDDV
jgi:hypothetical protein